MIKDIHLAVYGNVKILRGFCGRCERMALIRDDEFLCCGDLVLIDDSPKREKRMSDAVRRRKPLKLSVRKACLIEQDYRCLYCEQSFGGIVWLRGKQITLRVNWDHQVPFSFGHDNREENFAAACQVCNAWKSSLIFQSVDEVKIYVHQKWEQNRKAPTDLS